MTKIYKPELDGLRAVAIGLVVAFHVSKKIFVGGWVGVDVFFVLSGYLITGILIGEIDRLGHIAFSRFYARRALRLMPALAFLLSAVVIFELLTIRTSLTWIFWPVGMSAIYLMNWNRAFQWGPVGPLGHLWSLGIEEQFYFVWPLLLGFTPRRVRLAFSILLLAAALIWPAFLHFQGAGFDRLYNGFDTHAFGLIVGCVLAQIPLGRTLRSVAAKTAFIPVLAIFVIAFFLSYENTLAVIVFCPVIALLSAWIIIGSSENGFLKSVLVLSPMTFIGRISYGIYLWHDPLLVFFRDRLPWFAVPAIVFAAITIAAFSFYVIERPFLRLKSRSDTSGTARADDIARNPEPQSFVR